MIKNYSLKKMENLLFFLSINILIQKGKIHILYNKHPNYFKTFMFNWF